MKSLKIIKIRWLLSYFAVLNMFFINNVYRVVYKTITYVHLVKNLFLKLLLVGMMLRANGVMEREVEEEVIEYQS
jgi:hypothetical protein